MVQLIEDTKGKIRDLPIQPRLRDLLIEAAEVTGVDVVRVISGGQAKLGSSGKRTGSTRHDEGKAANLMLEIAGQPLSFATDAGLPIFEAFVTASARLGATGIGAGIGYIGPLPIHVGFGDPAIWGAGGKAANAPAWLRRAVAAASGGGDGTGTMPPPPANHYVVIARGGLRLRAGPGTDFGTRQILPMGTRVTATIDPKTPEWMQVDLEDDGMIDGYVYASFLAGA
jgi:hypothetical protein